MSFQEIDVKKRKLDQARPLPIHSVKSLLNHVLIDWTYNSNAIEGNTLTISETKVVLEGMTIGGKTMREHLEVINHRDAINFLEEIVQKHERLTEWTIKSIHRLVLKGIQDNNAGVFRNENVLIGGSSNRPPDHVIVQELMEQFVSKVENEWSTIHPVERAAKVHAEFVKIHPFIDGNGRTSRLLMNYEIMKAGFPPAVIKAIDRARYYDALDHAHTTGDDKKIVQLVSDSVDESLDLWLSVL
ncbi:Fic family protein [Paenisporosarcina macmurdoensis]|uniref:Fic family protein n=1 Tax=Paenisporosarcina macmurdoensis TaxID=212659 RepID=A0ABW1L7S3_9BACL